MLGANPLEGGFEFGETSSRHSFSDQPIPTGGVLRALRHSAEVSGIDPVSELYNEALRYATEGHLKPARERLQVLLSIAPEDGEARLLLAKVHVAGQRWQEALAALDEASACGHQVPGELRRAVEEHLRADQASEEEQRQARNAREQGEIKALRQEARRLRSENAQLLGRCSDLEKERTRWAWTAGGVAGVVTLFLLVSLVTGGGEPAEVAEAPVPEPVEAPATAPSEPEAPSGPEVASALTVETPSTTTVADRAARALSEAPGLDGTALEVEVRSGSATVRGVVPTFRHRKDAEQVLLAVDGITSVEAGDVEITSRTRGTTHEVRSGDNLSKLAYHYYGEASRSRDILRANRATLGGSANLQIGQKLTIPAID